MWRRFLVLLGGLCLVKLVLLFQLREQLAQTHWRFSGFAPGWLDYAAFVFVIAAGVLALNIITKHCERQGTRAVRIANLLIWGLGLAFVFLTFHAGDKNYIYPVMTGVLRWKDLGAYLSMDLFFHPPFLAAWLGGYALIYYALTRTNRERLSLRVTTGVVAVYAMLFFRDLPTLQASNADLPMIAVIGVAALIRARRSARPLGLGWLWISLAWVGMVWLLLAATEPKMRNPNSYFMLAGAVSVAILLAADLISRRGGFHHPWSNLAPFFFAAFLLLVLNHYPSAANDHAILALALGAPRYFVGEFLVASTVLVGAVLWRQLRPGGTLLPVDLLSLLLLAIAFVDLRLTEVMGARLDWDVFTFGYSAKMMWRLAQPYLPGVLIGLGCLVAGYAILLRLMSGAAPLLHHVRLTRSTYGLVPLAGISAILLACVGLVRVKPDKALGESVLKVAASSPAWRSLTSASLDPGQLESEADLLGIRWTRSGPVPLKPFSTNKLNVVFILLESTYDKYLELFGGTEGTQPLLSEYRDRMEIFPNFFSNFMGSIQARFACFTGLYPTTDYHHFTLERVPVKSAFEIFNDQGYTCSMFYSSHYDYTCFRDFLRGRGLDEMYDADNMPGERQTKPASWGLQESETVTAIQNRIKDYAHGGQPFFLTYIPACPHNPFDAIPDQFKRHELLTLGDYTPRYLNSLLYMDWAVASILDELQRQGLLDRTLVVITGDHGELLGQHDGKVGHGWMVSPELANVPLIILNPSRKGFHINTTIGSQVDLLPTIASLANIPLPRGEAYQGHSLYEDGPHSWTYINSYRQAAVVHDGMFCLGESGAEKSPFHPEAVETYRISNTGVQSVFKPVESPCTLHKPIEEFDRFQLCVLENYQRVAAMHHQTPAGREQNSESAVAALASPPRQ